jgi:ABC-type transport system substrate-binding protein
MIICRPERRSADFLERLSLPFFCTVPTDTPLLEGGVHTIAPPSAGPYYHSDGFNGEYQILKRNPNYTGPLAPKLDAIAFREGLSSENAVARLRSDEWDGAILFDDLLAPGGVVARQTAADERLRMEELQVRGIAYPGQTGALHALLSSRLGCDTVEGRPRPRHALHTRGMS